LKTSKIPVLRRSLLLLSSLLTIYALVRLIFYVYNRGLFSGFSNKEVAESFLLGLRFDLVAIVLSNLPVFIFFSLPSKWQQKSYLKALALSFFVVVNLLFISLNLADIELYQLTGKRSTIEFLKLAGDIQNQAVQLIVHYWYLSLAAVVLTYLLYRTFPAFVSSKKYRRVHPIFEYLILASLLALSARGGWQLKPLKSTNAFIFSKDELGILALNSTFTMIRSKGTQVQRRIESFSKSEQDKYLPTNITWASAPTHENVVLIILESFALEFVGAANGGNGYTPFFDELSAKGMLFKNGFANGRRSIEAIPSLLSGIPSLLPDPFITSDFSSNRIEGLGSVLRREGYTTGFFHGAENGTMYFDSFSQRAGFQHYFGLNEYPQKEDSDGHWGIFDEPYFQFAVREIDKMREPFASVIFSLSSHQPFSVPKKYAGRFPTGTLEIHESIGYTDFSLRKFFSEAEKRPWFNHTLFVITADHTTKSDQASYSDSLGHFRVPIFFYRPGGKLPLVDIEQVVQHVDIPLSIMQLLGVRPEKWTRFGRSIFSSQPEWVMNRTEAGYWYLDKDGLIKSDENGGGAEFYTPQGGRVLAVGNILDEKKRGQLDLRMRALLQYLFNGMLENKLLVESSGDTGH
jgi:phosphoglycerol transferase MdoB-like AlkP superfamily enzyme